MSFCLPCHKCFVLVGLRQILLAQRPKFERRWNNKDWDRIKVKWLHRSVWLLEMPRDQLYDANDCWDELWTWIRFCRLNCELSEVSQSGELAKNNESAEKHRCELTRNIGVCRIAHSSDGHGNSGIQRDRSISCEGWVRHGWPLSPLQLMMTMFSSTADRLQDMINRLRWLKSTTWISNWYVNKTKVWKIER